MTTRTAIVAAVLGCLFAASSAEAKLLGYWRFEEGAGTQTTDSTGQNPAASIIGQAAWSTTTAPQLSSSTRSIDIQGDTGVGLVELGNVVGLDTATDFTISMWFTLDSLPSSFPGLISKRSQFSGFDWELFMRDSSPDFFEYAVGGSFTDSLVTTFNPSTAPDWHHIAVVKDGSTLLMYLDGSTPQTQSNSNIIDGGDIVAVGVLQGGTGGGTGASNPWDGLVDEVAIFDTALDAATIAELAGGLPANQLFVPEPNSGVLLAAGLVGLCIRRRRR